jgi:hypothetical protein
MISGLLAEEIDVPLRQRERDGRNSVGLRREAKTLFD